MVVQVRTLPDLKTVWQVEDELIMRRGLVPSPIGRPLVRWLDTDRMWYSPSEVELEEACLRDAVTGRLVQPQEGAAREQVVPSVARLDSWGHEQRTAIGAFVCNGRRLFLPGGKEALAEDDSLAKCGDILLLDGGRLAIERQVGKGYGIDLIDGRGERCRVFDGWTSNFAMVELPPR